MPTSSRTRLELIVSTARSNPEFGRKLSAELDDDARSELVSRLSQPVRLPTTSLSGPGPKKCRPRVDANNGLSAQLNSFARAVARVR
jgi:hypothetical protein